MKRSIISFCIIFLLPFITFVWANNTNLFIYHDTPSSFRLLSHRGVHQIFAGDAVFNDTCTANPVHPIQHGFIENTIHSMRKAFEAGAEVVELDIHLTPDHVFAVFHDWRLECRTNGVGQTNKTPFAELQKLDAGYGYSQDGTGFPLRGRGIGLIPRLTEVFDSFPNGKFLINFKSNRRSEGTALLTLIDTQGYQHQIFGVYGGEKPTREVIDKNNTFRGFTWGSVKSCLLQYEALGWTGYVPKACRNTLLIVPINYAPLLWGWPHRFQQRMAKQNTEVILIGPYQGNRHILGIDDPEWFDQIPNGFNGYIWTNRIEQINTWKNRQQNSDATPK